MVANDESEFSAFRRFGGQTGWKVYDLYLGEAIAGEGPGEGFAMTPWILDKYERALRLRPGESWLLRRLLKHAWQFRQQVFVSLRRIEVEANLTRSTLQSYMRRLEELGYVRVVSDGFKYDRRKRYDVSGLYVALAICIAADPTSKWAEAHGGPIQVEKARKLVYNDSRQEFDIDFIELANLARSEGMESTDRNDGESCEDDN